MHSFTSVTMASADQVSTEKLQSFLSLAKRCRGRAAAGVISDALATPGLFAFGELLDCPHIQEARAASSRSWTCEREREQVRAVSDKRRSWRAPRTRRRLRCCASSPTARWQSTAARVVSCPPLYASR
jgi:hypothetical protein